MSRSTVLAALVAWPAAAVAAPSIVIEATVDLDAGRIRGWLRADELDEARWVDALSSLPVPEDELDLARTFPHRENHGALTWTREGDRLVFDATLPRRWGDVGATDHGLLANGTWYPQPLVDGGLPTVAWDVRLSTDDPDAVVVVGDVAAAREARWTGTAERASVAVLPRGRITPLGGPGWQVDVVTRGRPRPGLLRGLREELPLATLEGRRWEGVVVDGPLRRRLVRPGVGVAYTSDRLWRVFPWFKRMHHAAAVQGLLTAWQGDPDPFVRETAGALLAQRYADRLVRRLKVDLLGLTKWIPAVDAALYSREMPFRSELFKWPTSSDTIRDDLAERYGPHIPGTIVAHQVTDRFGEQARVTLTRHLGVGWSLSRAAAAAQVPLDALDALRVPLVTQDYRLALEEDAVVVTRLAPTDAHPETVVVDVDGERIAVDTPPGTSEHRLPLDEPATRVRLDPERHVSQLTRVGDLRPPPIRWTLSGQISSINISEGFVTAFLALTIRRADDTHNRFSVWAFTNQREYLGGRFTWTRYQGRLTRPTVREHAITFGVEGAWLNPRFADAGDARGSLGGTVGYAWDNRVSTLFPRQGVRLSIGASAGGTPGADKEWVRLSGGIEADVRLALRHVLAMRADTGFSATDLPQERLSFGGLFGVRGVPDAAVQTQVQGVGSVEYRALPMHQGSLPLGVLWVRDIQLIAGVDAGVGRRDGELVAAASAHGGLGVIVDWIGVSPGAAQVTMAVPVWWRGFEWERRLPFEIYLTWGATF